MTSNNPRRRSRRRMLEYLARHDPLTVRLLAAWDAAGQRLRQVRSTGERGATIVEYAIITAIALGLAIGLGAAITAVVHKYQGKIK